MVDLTVRTEKPCSGEEMMAALKKASEAYEALVENEKDVPAALEGVDITAALCRLDAYGAVQDDLPDLDAAARPLLLAFYLNLRDAEILRKLIVEQREHPQEMSLILAREFLRTLHEGSQLVPPLLRSLGPDEEQ